MKTLHYLKKALTLPPHVLMQKVFWRAKRTYQARKKKLRDSRFPTYEVHQKFSIHQFAQKVDLIPKEAVSQNAHFLKHEFDLLGSGWVRVFPGMQCKGIEGIVYPVQNRGSINQANAQESDRIRSLISQSYEPIDWHLDFKSGYRWNEDIWSEEIRYGSDLGADVKVPWELSRMQHLISLAWGYALDLEEKYVLEFQNQILDFIASNPPRYGVNWVCTMDVGIRVANWLLAYDVFRAYGASFDPEFEKIFSRSVYEHGKHIFHHLEWDPYLRSNHYLANIAGLLFASSYIGHDLWFEFSVRELKSEVMSQFHPDGSNFEASTSYHRLSSEMVFHSTDLALKKGAKFSEEYLERLQKMKQFISDATKPDGTMVQIGDNDSGRFIKSPLPEGTPRSFASYADFGLFIQRKDPWFLAIRCGSIGQKGNGGHAHNDQLSFELSVNGVSMIVDPGTYVYTPLPDQRRHFRSSKMHNTLAIEGKEQNLDKGLFQMADQAHAKMIEFKDGLFVGEHRGFGSVHRRTLKLTKEYVEGIDECDEIPKKIHFHFDPQWNVQIKDQEIECLCNSLRITIVSQEGFWEIAESEYSKAYGKKCPSKVAILTSLSQAALWKVIYDFKNR